MGTPSRGRGASSCCHADFCQDLYSCEVRKVGFWPANDSYSTDCHRLVLRLLHETLNRGCCSDLGSRRRRSIGVGSELSIVRSAVLFRFKANEVGERRHDDAACSVLYEEDAIMLLGALLLI
jgi:hypothetical protein